MGQNYKTRFETFVDTLTKDRIFGLDIVRSIAILLVVYKHGRWLLPDQLAFYYLLPLPHIDGVSIFFVLSGFLIGRPEQWIDYLNQLQDPTFYEQISRNAVASAQNFPETKMFEAFEKSLETIA